MEDETSSSSQSSFAESIAKFAYEVPSSSPQRSKLSSPSSSPTLSVISRRPTRPSRAVLSKASSAAASKRSTPGTKPPTLHRHRSSSARPAPRASPDDGAAAAAAAATVVVNNLVDSIDSNLILLFIGTNPGIKTASDGHAYAHPSNLYWKLMYAAGLTNRRCAPAEDRDLPRLYQYGHTNIVKRPTRDASMLRSEEMEAGVAVIEEKCRRWRPEAVCLVGKGIWEAVWKVWKGRNILKEDFWYGWQQDRMGAIKGEWEGARVFVATTTSGLASHMSYGEKLEIWEDLAQWVLRRRRERRREGLPIGEEVEESEHAFGLARMRDFDDEYDL